MVTPDGAVIVNATTAERRRARRQVSALVAKAHADLGYCRSTGDLRPLHDVFLDVARAMRLTMAHALDLEAEAEERPA